MSVLDGIVISETPIPLGGESHVKFVVERALREPSSRKYIAEELARGVPSYMRKPWVCGIPTGGALIGVLLADLLQVPFFTPETLPDQGFGRHLVIVDDVATTGASLRTVYERARAQGWTAHTVVLFDRRSA